MEERIWQDAYITAMSSEHPIQFAHHKTVDRPENHVLHINNYIEIYFYVSGNHRYIVEDSLYQLQRGDMIVINPKEVHKALPMGETEYERFYFLVDCHAFDGMSQNPLLPILQKPQSKGNLISPDARTRERVIETLYEIGECLREESGQLKALSLFLSILDVVNRHLEIDEVSVHTVKQTPSLLKRILVYIDENLAELQSTAEIASAVGITPQYLSAYFSKYTGTSLKVYIQAKKIALAKLLLDKGEDVTQACYDCGFNDCSYFIKVFKKYVGLTPFSYKQGLPR